MSEAYRLQALLELRGREEDAAKSALAQAERAVGDAREVVRATTEAQARSQAAWADARQALTTVSLRRASMVHAQTALVERRGAELETARRATRNAAEAEAAAEAAREVARERLSQCRQARETVEKHKAQWAEAQRSEAARREEMELDDLAQRRGGGARP